MFWMFMPVSGCKSISTGAQYVIPDSTCYCEKSKCAGWAQDIGFFASNSSSLPWLVKDSTLLCTSKKECNKLDLTAAQYFWLVDNTDWFRWFAISSSHVYAVPVTILLVGLPKKGDISYFPPLQIASSKGLRACTWEVPNSTLPRNWNPWRSIHP
jgi:hypothetical protein